MLFSLISGAYVDRLDRRRLVALVNVFRGAMMGLLGLAVWGGTATVAVVYVRSFSLAPARR